MKKGTLIVIAGPTAVGKTKLSIDLAKHLNAEIFSADSRQFYREMNIGTAKPSIEEMEGVPHHFINNKSVEDDYDAGQYEQEVIAQLSSYFTNKDYAILTGGTGLYLRAVMEGLDDFPPVPQSSIDKIEQLYEEGGLDLLHQLLERQDRPYFDEVDLNNSRRLIRALSLIDATGQRFSDLRLGIKKERNFHILPILLERDRASLYDRINERVHQMVADGLIQEAKSLYPKRGLKSLDTVGYSEIFMQMDGLIDIHGAIALIQRNSRRYAKRQMTWFRKGDWNTIQADSPNALEEVVKLIPANK